MTRRRRGPTDHFTWRGATRLTLLIFTLLVVGVGSAYTAANFVPATNVNDQSLPDRPATPTPPSECGGIATTNTVSGTVTVVGTDQNDWLIGSDVVDTLSGFGGDDCIEGKDGADVLEGGAGNDVCIGGPGIDVFFGCETELQ